MPLKIYKSAQSIHDSGSERILYKYRMFATQCTLLLAEALEILAEVGRLFLDSSRMPLVNRGCENFWELTLLPKNGHTFGRTFEQSG